MTPFGRPACVKAPLAFVVVTNDVSMITVAPATGFPVAASVTEPLSVAYCAAGGKAPELHPVAAAASNRSVR
jgi:hypothetical protein